ncbi:ABC transporter ATP-binding protein [Streptomyces sp. CA-179760]|uniref:ABC transporter ATP-binding protein n=1 Tax=Streptomyces sp. CA-179760 TaxID=3240054 RepID=UPI003D8A2E35
MLRELRALPAPLGLRQPGLAPALPRHRLPADEARQRIGAVAELLGISALLERPVGQLSNGQRQRVALGRVLVRPARAFLLDEPLSHLDAKLRQQMRAELKAIGAVQHTTTLYVTHDSVEALALGDRIGVIRQGRIVQTGTREEIWYQPYDTEVARAFGRPRINLLPAVVTESGVRADGGVELPVRAQASPGTDVLVGLRPRDIALRGEGHELTGSVYVTEVLGRSVEVTVRLGTGEQRVSLVAPGPTRHAFGRTIPYGSRSGLRTCCCSRPTGRSDRDDG